MPLGHIPFSYKLGDATFDEDDLFSPPSFDEEIYFDDTLPPIYDDYCEDTYAIKNKILQVYYLFPCCTFYYRFILPCFATPITHILPSLRRTSAPIQLLVS